MVCGVMIVKVRGHQLRDQTSLRRKLLQSLNEAGKRKHLVVLPQTHTLTPRMPTETFRGSQAGLPWSRRLGDYCVKE